MSWADGEGLSPDERAVWEDKVCFALHSERARERADVERKYAKENGPEIPPLPDPEDEAA